MGEDTSARKAGGFRRPGLEETSLEETGLEETGLVQKRVIGVRRSVATSGCLRMPSQTSFVETNEWFDQRCLLMSDSPEQEPNQGSDSVNDSQNLAPNGKPPQNDSASWMRFAGMGVELASYTLAMTAIGYAIDRYFENEKGIGVALGTLIGFSFGMFRFIQRAGRASR